jgi:hypothetical protein
MHHPCTFLETMSMSEKYTQEWLGGRTLIGSDRKSEVEEISRIGEVGLHGCRKVEFSQICTIRGGD